MFLTMRLTFGFSLFLACVAGCGGGGDGVTVEGVVTLDGQPLPGVQVLFDQPELPPNENKGYVGRTDEQGRYVLHPSLGEGSGVPPGKYRVALTTAVYDPSNPPQAPREAARSSAFFPESAPVPPERIPPAYRGGKLTFEVPEDGTEEANFALKSK
jgi:hypothetical protein